MTDPMNWEVADLDRLITDGVQESLTLDYKGAAALTPMTESVKTEISKDVSAFANSAGGIIVYGLREVNQLPAALEPIDTNLVTRERLEQVIDSRIQRRIDGLRIKQINIPGGAVFVVAVPQSLRAPHMASDHRYYKRFEFRSVMMEDYEVRDVSTRSAGPDLALALSISGGALHYDDGAVASRAVALKAIIRNDSKVPAEYALFSLVLDARLGPIVAGHTYGPAEVRVDDVPAHLWQVNWVVPHKMPIWSGARFRCIDRADIHVPRGPGKYVLGWSAKAPHMEERGRIAWLESDGATAVLRLTDVNLSA